MKIKHLVVTTPQGAAGDLLRESQFVFNYRTTDLACAASLLMPLRAQSYSGNQLPPAFGMNLPEGFLYQKIIERLAKYEAVDDMRLLAITGAHPIGRLRYEVPGETRATRTDRVRQVALPCPLTGARDRPYRPSHERNAASPSRSRRKRFLQAHPGRMGWWPNGHRTAQRPCGSTMSHPATRCLRHRVESRSSTSGLVLCPKEVRRSGPPVGCPLPSSRSALKRPDPGGNLTLCERPIDGHPLPAQAVAHADQ